MNIAQSGLGTVGGIEFGWYPQSRIEGAGSCNRMKDLRNGNADPEFHRFVSFDALEQQLGSQGGKGSTLPARQRSLPPSVDHEHRSTAPVVLGLHARD